MPNKFAALSNNELDDGSDVEEVSEQQMEDSSEEEEKVEQVTVEKHKKGGNHDAFLEHEKVVASPAEAIEAPLDAAVKIRPDNKQTPGAKKKDTTAVVGKANRFAALLVNDESSEEEAEEEGTQAAAPAATARIHTAGLSFKKPKKDTSQLARDRRCLQG
eukprot:gnl/TRDRNA2_/TRDRNA2_38250_c0_seq1.p1 gnl/TRDRNA2_/TRDRNA2_38250_c0~~gnl/TRDRNA2_/TRDRNA2_38250_c0_seq1.p1  ORF type:complete len:160 (+),score=38.43 gnl/TRDRNA2_/TRDRNA2_38250_c0_seq1:53-532(+)